MPTRDLPDTSAAFQRTRPDATIPALRIFISSPGDVGEERGIARRVITRLAGEFARRARLEPIFWEHEPLRATASFQSQIPRPSDTDIVVSILWSRLGTRVPADLTRPDGSRYASGTEFEFEDALAAWRERGVPELLVYRKTMDAPVSLSEGRHAILSRVAQKEALDDFVRRWFFDSTEGTLVNAFHSFARADEFEDLLEIHLRKVIVRRAPDIVGIDLDATLPSATWTAGSPFRGLQTFELEHAPVFFGRMAAVGGVLDALRAQYEAAKPFVMVLGMSGGGKSSLVRAGVLPLLMEPGVIEGVGLWRSAIFRAADASGDLLEGLASALLKPGALPELAADGTTTAGLGEVLRSTPAAGAPLIKGGLSQAAAEVQRLEGLTAQPQARLALVIDQMEELFTIEGIAAHERAAFVEAISALVHSGRVFVIATLRSDFYARCEEIPELAALKADRGQYHLLPPTSGEVAQIIRAPARAAGLRFEKGQDGEALDDVLRDAGIGRPGSLPLLEFALDELYKQRRDDGLLTRAAYVAMGGLEGALARRAEATYTTLSLEAQSTLSSVLHELVRVGSGDEEAFARKVAARDTVRRTVAMSELVDAFERERLFVADSDDAGRPVVSIVHEALLVAWPRATEWFEKNRENLRIRARVGSAARLWDTKGRPSDLLLATGKPLSEAESLEGATALTLTPLEQTFIERSHEKSRRWRRLVRGAVGLVTALAVAASVAAWVAIRQREATRKGLSASELREASLIQNTDYARALLLAARSAIDDPRNESARAFVFTSLTQTYHVLARLQHDSAVTDVSFSRDGERIVTASADHTAQIWDVGTWAKFGPPLRHDSTVTSASFSPDGMRILTSSFGAAQVWNLRGAKVGTPLRHNGWVYGAAFSRDGKRIVTVDDSTAQVWNAATGVKLMPTFTHHDRVVGADFRPGGDELVTASLDGNATLWEAGGYDFGLWRLSQQGSAIMSARFSLDGSRIVTAAQNGTAQVWNDSRRKAGASQISYSPYAIGSPVTHDGAIYDATFSPDGRQILTASLDHTAQVWDATTGARLGPPLRHNDAVKRASFSPDGQRIVTASSVYGRVWGPVTRAKPGPPLHHGAPVNSAIFSPDGTRIVTASDDSTAQVWDAATGARLGKPLRHALWVESAHFDRGRIVTRSGGWSREWDFATGAQVGEPQRAASIEVAPGYSRDDRRIVIRERVAQVWDKTGNVKLSPPLWHEDVIMRASFSPDGKRILTASRDGTAQVWDATTGDKLGPPVRYQDWILSASFSPDGQRILIASGDSAQVWDAATGQAADVGQLQTLVEAVVRSRIDNKGAVVPLSGADSVLAGFRRHAATVRNPAPGSFEELLQRLFVRAP